MTTFLHIVLAHEINNMHLDILNNVAIHKCLTYVKRNNQIKINLLFKMWELIVQTLENVKHVGCRYV